MKTLLPAKIETVEQAKQFLSDLHSNNETFHPEDDATQLVGDPFNQQEGTQLNKLMSDIYNLEGNNSAQDMIFDPCQFLLELDPDYITAENFDYRYGTALMAAKTQTEINAACDKFKAIAVTLNIQS